MLLKSITIILATNRPLDMSKAQITYFVNGECLIPQDAVKSKENLDLPVKKVTKMAEITSHVSFRLLLREQQTASNMTT